MKRTPPCPKCKKPGERIDKYDAYACLTCNVWLERHCGDSTCSVCKDRPENPLVPSAS